MDVVERHVAVLDGQFLTNLQYKCMRNVVAVHLIDFNGRGRRGKALPCHSVSTADVNNDVFQSTVFHLGVFCKQLLFAGGISRRLKVHWLWGPRLRKKFFHGLLCWLGGGG